MTDGPIISEVRKAREALYRHCGYDLKKLAQYLERRRKDTGLKTVRRKAKRTWPTPQTTGTPKH